MGFRFRKRIKIAPGININLSKSGISTSLGTRGATVNIGKKGARATVGLPGTGLSYQTKLGARSNKGAPKAAVQTPGLEAPSTLPEVWRSLQSSSLTEGDGLGCLLHAMMLSAIFILPPMLAHTSDALAVLAFAGVLVAWVFIARWRKREWQRRIDVFDAEKRIELDRIWRTLVEKFDEETARRVLDSELRIGDSREVVEAIFGEPEDVSERVMKSKTRHVLKYGRLNARSFAMKITLEDDVVVGWDN